MPSINVYVSDDLKARMDRAADGVNWSSVAQSAFEKALALYPTMEGSKMSAVLERLKASKAEQVDSVAAAGFAAGRAWAESAADYLTLKRVGEYDWSDDEGDDIAALFEQIARVEPETFWANHPKEERRETEAEDFRGVPIPPIPPMPPMAPVAAGAPGAAVAHRVALRSVRRAHAAAARAMRHGRDAARPSSFYVQGFARGAASVWTEVKAAL
jgi:hypothetical protein